jgi:multiple sugar transport system substrate-binding protein
MVLLLVVIGLFVGLSVSAVASQIRVSGWVSSPAESKMIQTLIDNYNEYYAPAGSSVVYEPIPADFPMKIQTMLAAKNAPGVFYWDIFLAEALMKKGALLPLNDLMVAAGIQPEEFIDTCINAFSYDGKIYGIAKDLNTLALFYNKKIFDAAGVSYPTNDWTWDDLQAAAKVIQAKADDIRAAGFPNFKVSLCMASDTARFLPFVFQNGGSFFNADRTQVVINSPEAVEALKFYTDFELEDGTAMRPSEIGAGWQGEAFGKENVAMVMEGGWMVSFLADSFPDVDYSAVELAQGPAGRGNMLFTVAYVIPATESDPELAFELLDYLTNTTTQMHVLMKGFALPTRKALATFIEDPISMTIAKGASYAHPWEFGLLGSTAVDEIVNVLDAVFLGRKTPQKALDDVAEILNDALATIE